MAQKQKYTKAEWVILDKNTRLAACLGFDVSNTAFWTSKKDKNTGSTKYSKCNFSNGCVWDESLRTVRKTPLKSFLSSNFGKEPVFDEFRIPKKPNLIKWKNVIAPIAHPNIFVYDFDNHDNLASLSQKIQEIYERLHQNKDLLIGYKTGFNGLHVFCLVQHKSIVEKECEEFESTGGHIDIFNSEKGNGIGIPGFDHYLYKEEEVQHFIDIAEVQIEGRLSIYQSKPDQPIKYPKPLEISPDVIETIQLYKAAKANIKSHKDGVKNCVMWRHNTGVERGVEYIESLMSAKGHRTEILLSSNGHEYITRALSNLNIQDITDFRKRFPDFEENHYKLIEERIEYIKNTKNKTTSTRIQCDKNYKEDILELNASLREFFISNGIKPKKELLFVATYLANCTHRNIRCPGYIHYIEFCKMNELEIIPERSYYRIVKECKDHRLISIPNGGVWTVGKKCGEIIKGHLLYVFDFERSKKVLHKVFDYIQVNVTYNKLYSYSFFSTVLCTAKNAIVTITDMFNMQNFYYLRP